MKQLFCKTLFSRALVTWLLFIPIVVLNGTIREAVYKPFIGELVAHQVSTVTASAAFFALVYFRLRHHLMTASNESLPRVGLMWVALTVLFEFALGRFILGASWDKLFHDYNILAGRIWSLLLLTLLLTPVILKHLIVRRRPTQYHYGR